MRQFIPFLFLIIVSCKHELPEVPKDVIPVEEMRMILSDIHVADAVAETKGATGQNEKELTREYDEQIYRNHGVTRSLFLKSFKYYEDNPKWLNKMYDSILVELSKREEAAAKK